MTLSLNNTLSKQICAEQLHHTLVISMKSGGWASPSCTCLHVSFPVPLPTPQPCHLLCPCPSRWQSSISTCRVLVTVARTSPRSSRPVRSNCLRTNTKTSFPFPALVCQGSRGHASRGQLHGAGHVRTRHLSQKRYLQTCETVTTHTLPFVKITSSKNTLC